MMFCLFILVFASTRNFLLLNVEQVTHKLYKLPTFLTKRIVSTDLTKCNLLIKSIVNKILSTHLPMVIFLILKKCINTAAAINISHLKFFWAKISK